MPGRSHSGFDGRAHRIGGGDQDVGAFHRLFGRIHGANIQIERFAIMLGEAPAVFRRRAEDPDLFEAPHGRDRFELAARLETGAEQPKHLGVFAREIFRRHAAGRADAGALHHAVIHHRQKLARVGRKQQHLAVVAAARFGEMQLHPARQAVDDGAGDDVGIQPDRRDAGRGPASRHGFQIVDGAFARIRHDRVLARNVDRILIAEIAERRLDCQDALWHGEKRLDVFIGKKNHGARVLKLGSRR